MLLLLIALVFGIAGVVLGGCGGDDGEGGGSKAGGSINVAIVDIPQTQDLAHLTPSLFTAETPHQGELHDPRRGHLA